MSSDSDSDNEIKMKQFLEAADTTLLNNSMFQKSKQISEKLENALGNNASEKADNKKEPPKTQRYIQEGDESHGTYFNIPESMQNHLAKKMTEILKQQYEFYDVSENFNLDSNEYKFKSRVKLLKTHDCYVKPYEEFNYETKGPNKKPIIKRRIVDKLAEENCNIEEHYRLAAIDGNYILSGTEVKMWAKKKERKDKVFYYKMSSHGVLHIQEETNEFRELKRKNKWNENKIKNVKQIFLKE